MAGKGTLTVYFMGDAKALKKTIANVKTTIFGIKSSFSQAFSGISGIISKVMGPLGLALGGGGIVALIGKGIAKYAEAEKSIRKLEAVLKSSGYSAGYSAKEMENMAGKLSKVSKFSRGEFINAETVMATFRNVQGDIFQESIQSAADLSSVMGQDLQSSVVQLGKALNDPIRGITALRRGGVNFSDEQQQQIKNLVKQGDLLSAQKMIMAEVNAEFGGAAAAEMNTISGKITMINRDWGAFLKGIGEATVKAADMGGILDQIRTTLAYIKEWASFSLPEWINTVKFLWVEFKFGILKAWEIGKAMFASYFFMVYGLFENIKIVLTWLPSGMFKVLKAIGSAWIDTWAGIFRFISDGFGALWDAIKTGSLEGLGDQMAKAGAKLAESMKLSLANIIIQTPELYDTMEGVNSIFGDLKATLADLDAEKALAIDDLFKKQIERVNAIAGASIDKKKLAPANIPDPKKTAEMVQSKFAGAAEKGSLEAYRIQIGNQMNVQKQIASNTADTADKSEKMVELLEDINNNLEGGEAFAF